MMKEQLEEILAKSEPALSKKTKLAFLGFLTAGLTILSLLLPEDSRVPILLPLSVLLAWLSIWLLSLLAKKEVEKRKLESDLKRSRDPNDLEGVFRKLSNLELSIVYRIYEMSLYSKGELEEDFDLDRNQRKHFMRKLWDMRLIKMESENAVEDLEIYSLDRLGLSLAVEKLEPNKASLTTGTSPA